MGSDGYIIHIHHSSQQVKKRFRFVITIIYKSNLYITNECLYIATCSGLKKTKTTTSTQPQQQPGQPFSKRVTDAWDECEVQRTAGSEKSPPGSAPQEALGP